MAKAMKWNIITQHKLQLIFGGISQRWDISGAELDTREFKLLQNVTAMKSSSLFSLPLFLLLFPSPWKMSSRYEGFLNSEAIHHTTYCLQSFFLKYSAVMTELNDTLKCCLLLSFTFLLKSDIVQH